MANSTPSEMSEYPNVGGHTDRVCNGFQWDEDPSSAVVKSDENQSTEPLVVVIYVQAGNSVSDSIPNEQSEST